jgi:hypothetical protein
MSKKNKYIAVETYEGNPDGESVASTGSSLEEVKENLAQSLDGDYGYAHDYEGNRFNIYKLQEQVVVKVKTDVIFEEVDD